MIDQAYLEHRAHTYLSQRQAEAARHNAIRQTQRQTTKVPLSMIRNPGTVRQLLSKLRYHL
jgi:formiminotetrahydrofolate cyclodeaminase